MSSDQVLMTDIFKELMKSAFDEHTEIVKNYIDEHTRMTMDFDKVHSEAIKKIWENIKNIEERLSYIEGHLVL